MRLHARIGARASQFGVVSNERDDTTAFPVDHLEARLNLLQSGRV
jgi:hypothetical protein